MLQQGREGWLCAGSLHPSIFHSSPVIVLARKRQKASMSFLMSHAGSGMHKRRWWLVQLTSSGTHGLCQLQRGIELALAVQQGGQGELELPL